MYSIVSHTRGFYKLLKDKIYYNVSEKKFAEMEADGLISGKVKVKSEKSKDVSKTSINDVPPLTESEELALLKKDDLIELAKRIGYAEEITPSVTKAILIEFIIQNKAK